MPRPEEQAEQSDLNLVEGVLADLTGNGQRLVTYAELSRQVMLNHPYFKNRQYTRRGRAADRIRERIGRPLGSESIGVPFKYTQATSNGIRELTDAGQLNYLFRHPDGELRSEIPQPLPSAGQPPLVRLYNYIPQSTGEAEPAPLVMM